MTSGQRGFTFVECGIVCAVVAVLATVALPSYRGNERRMARLDAVQALTRVQTEQEKFRNAHGLYASEMSALRGVTVQTAQARYVLSLERIDTDRYRAVALAQGHQAKDKDCTALTLEVSQGFPTFGPKAACWNR